MEDVVNKMIQVLIPDLPADRLKAFTFSYKAGFLDWWRKKNAPAPGADAGEVQAGKPIRGRRSPASAASTDSTLSAS